MADYSNIPVDMSPGWCSNQKCRNVGPRCIGSRCHLCCVAEAHKHKPPPAAGEFDPREPELVADTPYKELMG